MSANLSSERPASEVPAGAPSTLHVEVVFRDIDEHQAHAISAELIGRAHELANLPDFECDVDVSVQMVSPRDDGSPGASAL